MKVGFDIGGLEAVKARLRGLSEGKITVAAVSALNQAARAGYEATRNEMSRVFDRPTPWVKGGVQYIKAGRAGAAVRVPGAFDAAGAPLSNALASDRPEAQIDFDRWGNKQGVSVDNILAAEVAGGNRRHKRHEIALQRAGILPAGFYVVPGAAAQLDAYGSMKSSQIVQIMSWFKSFGEQGYRANMTDARRQRLGKDKRNGQRGIQYFALRQRKGNLLPGVYQRFSFAAGSAIKPVMIFVRAPAYQPRFDFYGIAEKTARTEFERAFPMYLSQLLRERGL